MVETTPGRVVSGVSPVLKFHTKLRTSELPARSVAAVVMVTAKVVRGARLAVGLKVAVRPT